MKMKPQIDKRTIIDFLKKNYNLENNYELKYGNLFNDAQTGFKELVRVFNTYTVNWIWPTRKESFEAVQKVALRRYLSELGQTSSQTDKILEFIKGQKINSAKEYHPHQWHLGSFYKKTAGILTQDFIDFYTNINLCKDFEDVYDQLECIKAKREEIHLRETEPRKLGFGQVCLYDTALRMTYCFTDGDEEHRLMPRAFVYLHAKPLKTGQLLRDLGIINCKLNHRTKTEMLQKIFIPYDMKPIDIENFLCVMNGPIRVLAGLPLKEGKAKK